MDPEADLLVALRKLAGVASGGDFTIKDRDVAFDVDYMGGSSSRLILRAVYSRVAHADVAAGVREAGYRASARGGALTAPRPMSIVTRREDHADREAKAEGVSREYQTGDTGFDDAVYVDSPTKDPVVLGAVLNDGTRAAVRELLALGFDTVVLDDSWGCVTAVISGFSHLTAPDEGAGHIVRAFANLLRSLPPVVAGRGMHPQRSALPVVAAVTGGIALFVGGPIGFLGVAGAHECTEASDDGEGVTLKDGCGGTAVLGLVAAIVAGAVAVPAVRGIARPLLSGDSDSHKRLAYVSVAAFSWAALIALVGVAAIGYGGR